MSATIRYGWALGDQAVVVPGAQIPGEEDFHHFTSARHYLPSNREDWKRWRYRDDVHTVFWWEAPTRAEKQAVDAALGLDSATNRHIFVELNSTRPKYRERKPGTRKFNLSDLEDRGHDPGILDVSHSPDAPTDAMERWLAHVGDSVTPAMVVNFLIEANIRPVG